MSENNEKPRVLMVDDDPDFQTIVRGWISPQYDHIGRANGNNLIEQLEGLKPNLVLLDVRMPGHDGFELCNRIRAERRFTRIPILFLTSCKADVNFIKAVCGQRVW